MKNPYRKEKVHPSPSGGGGQPEVMSALKLLPGAILAKTAALRPEDKEALAYLIKRSTSGPVVPGDERRCGKGAGGGGGVGTHQAVFDCGCFDCYTGFWSRWHCSPDRELMHQAIDAFEDSLAGKEHGGRGRRRERSKGKKKVRKAEEKKVELPTVAAADGDGCSGGEKAAEVLEVEETETETDLSMEKKQPHEEEEEEEELPLAPGGERRRGWSDVMGLFNLRLWSLWGPAV